MTDLDAKEARLLAGVRRAWSPEPSDQARVLASLEAARLVPPAPVGAATISRYLLGVLALGVAGFAGYGWGYRAGSAARVTPAVAVAGSSAPEPATTPARMIEAPPVAAPAPSSPPRPSAPSLPRAVAPTNVGSPIASVEPPGLDEEVRQLRRIERAIRAGNPRLALVLAEELDRAIPNGQLLHERRAAALMASCQLGAEGAAKRAQLFLAQSPNSAYAPRVREMCEGAQRSPPAPGTDRGNQGDNR